MTKPAFACSCDDCQSAYRNKPGWFLPGEAQALAAAMGMSLGDLFRDRLAVDWWVGDPRDEVTEEEQLESTFVLSPAIKGRQAGIEFPGDPNGACTFFKDGKCEIHALGKPYECAALTHDGHAQHVDIARAWTAYQAQIHDLLGREPEAEEVSLWAIFGSLLR